MVTKIQSRNLKFEYVVGYRKNSIKFNIHVALSNQADWHQKAGLLPQFKW